MPQLIMLALGAVGVLLARVLVREARRINAELHPQRPAGAEPGRDRTIPLERDPATGVYRPKRR